MIRGRAVLDHGRDVVTVTVGSIWEGDWGPVTSRENALDQIAAAGWRPAPGANWAISPADNGRVVNVIKDK